MSKIDSSDWSTFVSHLDKSKTVIVHCAGGVRAKRVADKLAQMGFHTAYFKGPDQWKSAGLPVKAGTTK